MIDKNQIRIVYLLAILTIVASCKKFEEDPFFTFTSARKRLTGSWKLEKYLINGIDSTAHLKATTTYIIYRFYYENEAAVKKWILLLNNHSDNTITSGSWSMNKRNEKLYTRFDANAYVTPTSAFGASEEVIWDNYRFYNNEMRLETEYKGRLFELNLRKL